VLNGQLPSSGQLVKSPATRLFDPAGGALDSLGLVNLIVALEQTLEDDHGLTLSLADETARTDGRNPFETVDTLAHHIALLIGDHASRRA
jgi:acyl carrier protein